MTDRKTKTPRQRATEALAVADRKVDRLKKDVEKHETALRGLKTELRAAAVRRDYLKGHPDLAEQAATAAPEETP